MTGFAPEPEPAILNEHWEPDERGTRQLVRVCTTTAEMFPELSPGGRIVKRLWLPNGPSELVELGR